MAVARRVPCIQPTMRLNEIKTPVLRMAYEESGPKKGERILLVHGWPDSPRTWDKVLPYLHEAGYLTIAPYLRGYGPTEFRDPLLGRRPRRTGQAVALAQDMIDLADKLGMRQFHIVGHDWGARAAYVLAALHPQRLKSAVAVSVSFVPAPRPLPTYAQSRAYWYQWLLNTPTGEKLLREDPVAFGKAQWDSWSPRGWYTQAELEEAARSWSGKNYPDVVLQYYRSTWNPEALDPRYQVLHDRLQAVTVLNTPTTLIHGMEDTCVLPETTDGAERNFAANYKRVLLDGVGHFPQRENPRASAEAILRHLQVHV